MVFRVLLFLGIVFLIDLYVFQAVRILTRDLSVQSSRVLNGLYWSVTIFTFLVFIAGLIFDWHSWPKALRVYTFAIVILFFISKLFVVLFLMVEDITRFFRWAFANLYQRIYDVPENSPAEGKVVISRSSFLVKMAFVIASVPFLSLIYGMVKGKYDYQVKRRKLRLKNLPSSFNGFKIVHISDIHTGSFFDTQPLMDASAIINRLNADVVFFTGDLVNDRSDEALPHMAALSNIKAPHGVYSILGNHDYGDYVTWPSQEAKRKNLEQLKSIHEQLGWKLLLDEHTFIEKEGNQIGVIGVQNWSTHMRFPKYGDLHKAIQNMSFAPVNILLSHDPSHWQAEVVNKTPQINLTLSGHTHGFQFGVEIPSLKVKWIPFQYVYKEWADLYTASDNQHLYVNRGLGFLGYPGRVGILPEITLIELEQA